MANNGAFIDKGTLLVQLEWMRDGGTQYDRFRTPAEIDAYNAALRDPRCDPAHQAYAHPLRHQQLDGHPAACAQVSPAE